MKNLILFITLVSFLSISCKKNNITEKDSLLISKTWRYKTLVEAYGYGMTSHQICRDHVTNFQSSGVQSVTECYETYEDTWKWIEFDKKIEIELTANVQYKFITHTILEMNDTLLILKVQSDTTSSSYLVYKYSGKVLSDTEWSEFTGSSFIINQ